MNLIDFDKTTQIFHLSNGLISYIMQIEEGARLAHVYFGKAIRNYHNHHGYQRIARSFSPNLPNSTERDYSLDTLRQEYPSFGSGDFRDPAITILQENGSRITDFVFLEHKIEKGKPKLVGLPSANITKVDDAETLTIVLEDSVTGVKLYFLYTIYAKQPIITRSVKVVNNGKKVVKIEKIASLNIDFSSANLDLIHLPGTHSGERSICKEKITSGIKVIDSKRGTSSHQHNPFIVLADQMTTEYSGEAFGFALVYSGNHATVIQKDQFNQLRINMGINPHQFLWTLEPGDTFQTPEAWSTYSDNGFNRLSQNFHQMISENLVSENFIRKERPILINNWEATYFDFTQEKIKRVADIAAQVGIELFVLDDGWFGKREDDNSSLGDWYENRNKLPQGLKSLSEYIHQKGMLFGLWFEPEMISQDSNLFRNNPDWLLQVPDREPAPSRGQYVLDFSRKEIRENIYLQMKNILDNVQVDYIKWDMNRSLSDIYSVSLGTDRQGEVSHRYVLGLYEFMNKLIKNYPSILFESCSGGGGRFDLGLLHYMPQVWTSDNSDAIDRLKIQYGTSLIYPPSTMGAHVSAVPNHQTLRTTSLEMRGNVAMSGLLGYELDLTQLSETEITEARKQIVFYKEHRSLLQFGNFYRLISPFEESRASWMFVADNQKEAIVFYFQVTAEAVPYLNNLKLKGLNTDFIYSDGEGKKFGGDELMHLGLCLDYTLQGDYSSQMFHLKVL